MKKIASMILVVLLVCTMLPLAASAELVINGRRELGSGTYDDIYIDDYAELVICGDVKLEKQVFASSIVFDDHAKLTVKNGCRLTGENVMITLVRSGHKIEIEDGGKIEITLKYDKDVGKFTSILNNSGIPFKIEDNTIIAPYGNWGASWDGDGYYLIRNVSTGNVFDVAGGNDTSNYKKETAVGPWYPNYQENQIFKIKSIDTARKAQISPKYEGNGVLYVNAFGGARYGAELKLWDDGNSKDSQWFLEEQDSGKYIIESGNGNWYIREIDGKFVLRPRDEASVFELQKDGYSIVFDTPWDGESSYKIRNSSNGNVFEIAGGNNTSNYNDGTSVVTGTENNQEYQSFKIGQIDIYGKVLISPIYEGNRALYVNAYGGAGENVELKLWHDETSIDSQWYLEEQDGGKYKIRSGNRSWYVCDDGGKLKLTNEDSATVFEIQKIENPTGSVFSGGNWWIIGIGAVVILGGIIAAVIVAKKRKKAE